MAEERVHYTPIEDKQNKLFEDFQPWQQEWKGMPEFIQENTEAYYTVVVRFSCEDDLLDFSRLIGQELSKGREAASIWHPKAETGSLHMQSSMRYDDES